MSRSAEHDRPGRRVTGGTEAVVLSIRRDRIVQAALGALGVLVALYVLPFSSSAMRLQLTRHVGPIVFLSLTIFAVFRGMSTIPRRHERLFWQSVGAAFCLWLSARLMILISPGLGLVLSVVSDLLYATFYLALVLAVDSRPHVRSEWPFESFERALRWIAISLFVCGLLAYFVFLPAIVSPTSYGSYLPSMFLFIALDSYIAVKLALYAVTAKSARWRTIYVLVCLGMLSVAASDSIEALHYSKTITWPWGSLGDIVFLPPFLFVILAARSRSFMGAEPADQDEIAQDPLRSLAHQLISYALMLPIIHFTGYLLGVFDWSVHDPREMLVLFWLVLIGGTAILQHSLLARRARHLASETSRTAEALRESEERMQLILDRQTAWDAQRLSELKFTRVFQSSPDPLLIATVPEGIMLDVNDTFLATTGLVRDAVIGNRIKDLGLISAADWRSLSVTMSGQGRIKDLEVDFRLPSGRIVASMVSSEPIDLDGEACVIVTARDITERRKFESVREHLIAELEAKNAELGRFTYTVSHDLKSPLITIRGFLGLLEKDAIDGDVDRLKLDVAQILEATSQMQRLLDELLELSRIGRITHTPRNVPMGEIVEECLRVLAGPIESHGVIVEVESNLPVVYGDRVRILQLLQNLVDNAIKFMGDQPEPYIWIGCDESDGAHLCYVRDNGIGIEPRFGERVFGLFERLDPEGPGTGIGLAIVKRIVEYHGGRVWVESEGLGKGSRFCFVLPNAGQLTEELGEGART